ncbi:MAG TPA: hypothetical protein PLJ18_12155 [Niabella sp.]|nr:hypothetical protein [Niabella sp.]
MIEEKMTGYELSRRWFDWCFENQEKISTNHTALYFFIIEHHNRMGWVSKFGLPSDMAKSAIGIKSYNTYIKTLNDLIDWGFIKMVQKSRNQYSANIIALSKNNKALDKALDKAIIKHSTKQRESIDSINKPINNRTIEPINLLSNKNLTQEKKCEYWKKFVEKWEKWYLEKFQSNYNYQAKDFACLKKIHLFFKKRAESKNFEFTEENLLAAFDFFLKKAWEKDDWLKNNFSIPNLLSQFNQIANNNGNSKTTGSKQPTGADVSMSGIAQKLAAMPNR